MEYAHTCKDRMENQIFAIDCIKYNHNDHCNKDTHSEFQCDVNNQFPSNDVNCFDEIVDDCDYNNRVREGCDKNADILNHAGDRNDDYCGDDGYDADNGDVNSSESYHGGDVRENCNNVDINNDVNGNKFKNRSDANDDSNENDGNGDSNGCVSGLGVMFDYILYDNHDGPGKIKVGDDGYRVDNVNHGGDGDVYSTSNGSCEVSVKYSDDGEVCGNKSESDEGTSDYITCEDIGSNEDNIFDDTVDQALLQDNVREIKNTYHNNENKEQISSPIQLIKSCGVCSNRQYDNVMNTLEEFQTQSNWGKHKSLTSCFIQSSEITPDLKIVLFLEQGMAEIMQKHFSLGKRLFRQALLLCSQSKNMCMLQGRALMFLGNAYRKEGPIKYGKAFEFLTLAQQNLCLVESREDQAELNYFLGALYLNLQSISIHEPCQRSRERIEKHYQAVYDYAMADTASRVREKVQRIFPLGMANFLLDGQTELARSRVVPEIKLKKAEDCLKYFSAHFPFDEQPVSMQTDYCKSKADLEYRRGNFCLSQDFLQKGLNISRRHNYHLEVQSLEKRLAMLKKCLPRVPVLLPLEDTADFADHSATVDSEINVFTSGSE